MKYPRTHHVISSPPHAPGRAVNKNTPGPDHHTLSEREFEVLVLMAQGQSLKHIAQSLTLSIKTVSTYRARLLDKLQLTTTAELICYALNHHLLGSHNDDSLAHK